MSEKDPLVFLDISIVRAIISNDLPGLKEKVQNLLNELEATQ